MEIRLLLFQKIHSNKRNTDQIMNTKNNSNQKRARTKGFEKNISF